jgi:molybdopterin-guanine dinucleotide biosynthesis protein B
MTCESECLIKDSVELEVNGETIELNTFIQGFIAQTVKGMVCSLRGAANPETISVKITRKS